MPEDLTLNLAKLSRFNSDLLVMHPLPRSTEIPTEIDDDPRMKYWTQVSLGRSIRRRCICWCLS